MIRILNDSSSGEDYYILYEKWLRKWLGIDFNKKEFIIGFKKGESQSLGIVRLIRNKIAFYSETAAELEGKRPLAVIKLSHGNENEFNCNIRSHGAFCQRFFKGYTSDNLVECKLNVSENNELVSDQETIKLNSGLLFELVEVVLTKIVIFDNRINDRMNAYSLIKRENLNEQLKFEVFGEKKNEWDKFIIGSKNDVNFLVVHLSFIEALGYNEKSIEDFISNQLKKFIHKKNFIFVITSGRGRDEWRDSIKTKQYETFTIFKPIEAILDCVEHGITYNDHFDIKYYLVKNLFGS